MPLLKVKYRNSLYICFKAGDLIVITTEITVPIPIKEITFYIGRLWVTVKATVGFDLEKFQ